MTARSYLFLPGDSEKKLGKGATSGSDALILDLEDSVSPDRKAVARGMVSEYLAAHDGAKQELWVRMNPLAEGGLDDLVAVVRGRPYGIMVPKADHPSELVKISHLLDALERRDGVTRPIRLLP
ncbi:MAG: aldolase/citrate lyase family protein, partial [Gemmobacter sp.]|nr:aldolase/citrate lyase family protein [Gemmobacter sp.]